MSSILPTERKEREDVRLDGILQELATRTFCMAIRRGLAPKAELTRTILCDAIFFLCFWRT
jgi:hypothetical protein